MINDSDYEFLEMADLLDVNQEQLDQALDCFEENEISFDVFVFCQLLQEASLPFMINKIFQKHDFFKDYHIKI